MKRTLTTKYVSVEFSLPRNPYIPNSSYPRSVAYINMRIAALRRFYPGATRIFHFLPQCGPVDVIRVVLPIRHTFSKPAWGVYRTAFHGGGLISRHYTQAEADCAARRWVGETDCLCGCAGVIAPDGKPCDVEINQNITHNPYALTD